MAAALNELLSDEANLLGACNTGHLGLVETGAVKPDSEDLGRRFIDFVIEWDLEADVPRHLRDWVEENV